MLLHNVLLQAYKQDLLWAWLYHEDKDVVMVRRLVLTVHAERSIYMIQVVVVVKLMECAIHQLRCPLEALPYFVTLK